MTISIFPGLGHSLPSFESLLIKGAYPPSASIHLCISHLQSFVHSAEPASVLFLTPSRQSFATVLQDYNDGWLTGHAATGAVARLLSKINIYYPPSAAHWLLLLSSLKPPSALSSKLAVLPHIPSLIVLHEPSAYFLSSEPSQTQTELDLSRYLQLVTTALTTASFFSPHNPIPVVLFDSRLGELRLPITKSLTPSRRLFQDHEDEVPLRQEHVERFVEKYFDWIGSVVDEHDTRVHNTPPRYGTFDSPEKRRTGPFKLFLKKQSSDEQVVLEWAEVKHTQKSGAAILETTFVF
ncbi:hypothetical protein M0805_005352 [Coniferiporia weirii]|nr:hypothetical protein M0805_005352 [Coniferiporia weirii]